MGTGEGGTHCGAKGWAVVDVVGAIDVRTVSETRRAAVVNWLVASARVMVGHHHTDAWIETSWNNLRGKNDVVQVMVCVADGGG